ncbi:hypothetical protein C7212DRAFT_364563 [Tuber magnatum]|uniref:C2H2-type domain-containing protein n=1 Tax=Tuber magnatum TaxID=42249 RepID=A0A317SP53_9PEZI|nr:hypothetical protein C7212DRAFT_364563 [Tuber magnatum]
MPSLHSTFDTRPAMLYCAGRQPHSTGQEFQETHAAPSGRWGFLNHPRVFYTLSNPNHPSVQPPGYLPTAYGSRQSLEPYDCGNDFQELRFDIQQCQSLPVPPFSPEEYLGWPYEAGVQSSHSHHERQLWGSAGRNITIQGVADTVSYADESDTTSLGQSSPSVPGNHHPGVTVGLDQPLPGASVRQHTFCGISAYTRELARHQSEHPPIQQALEITPLPLIHRGTPLTRMLADTDSYYNPGNPTAHSNRRHRAQQQAQQDTKPPPRKRSSVTCLLCGALFGRNGDLQRHLATAKHMFQRMGRSARGRTASTPTRGLRERTT